jgi:hypothetical protein
MGRCLSPYSIHSPPQMVVEETESDGEVTFLLRITFLFFCLSVFLSPFLALALFFFQRLPFSLTHAHTHPLLSSHSLFFPQVCGISTQWRWVIVSGMRADHSTLETQSAMRSMGRCSFDWRHTPIQICVTT